MKINQMQRLKNVKDADLFITQSCVAEMCSALSLCSVSWSASANAQYEPFSTPHMVLRSPHCTVL